MSSCLLIIAHPDDECMFFGPSLIELLKQGSKVRVLCLSTGNAHGLGPIRQRELEQSCLKLGINSRDVTCLDDSSLQDGQQWNPSDVASRVNSYLSSSPSVDMVLTFDSRGVSGHQNHRATALGVALGLQGCTDTKMYELATLPLWAKYSCFVPGAYWWSASLWLLVQWMKIYTSSSLFGAQCSNKLVVTQAPLTGWHAMRKHASQMVWFRYLWLMFSVYMVCNVLRSVH